MPRQYDLMQVFESKRSGKQYEVKASLSLSTGELELSCNCRGWIYNKTCKHKDYVNGNTGFPNLESVVAI